MVKNLKNLLLPMEMESKMPSHEGSENSERTLIPCTETQVCSGDSSFDDSESSGEGQESEDPHPQQWHEHLSGSLDPDYEPERKVS